MSAQNGQGHRTSIGIEPAFGNHPMNHGNALPLLIALAAATLLLAGCGLADTAVGGAAGAAAEAQQAQQAPQVEQHVRDQLQDAQDTAAAQRDKAEQDAQ